MKARHENLHVATIPKRLFSTRLKNGWKEFFCYLSFQKDQDPALKSVKWEFFLSGNKHAISSGNRIPTKKELANGRMAIATLLPPEWEHGELTVEIGFAQTSASFSWKVEPFHQSERFRIPFEGQVMIFGSHRIGEVHRAAWEISSQQMGWDLLPMDTNGLRLLKGVLTEKILATDFSAFGQAVLAPAAGRVSAAVDGVADHIELGGNPGDIGYYLEDLRRACGNYLIIEHGSGVWSCLAHLRNGSVKLQPGDVISAGQVIGELGNSGNSTGPHLHIHFMDGPDLLTAAALPIEFEMEGEIYDPQAGEIVAS